MPIYEYQCQECSAISEKLLVGGECIYPSCGKRAPHERGVPCIVPHHPD